MLKDIFLVQHIMCMVILENLEMLPIQAFCQKKLNGIIIYNKNDDL